MEIELTEPGWVILFKNDAHEAKTRQRWARQRELDLKLGEMLLHLSDHQLLIAQKRVARFNIGVLKQHKKEKTKWVYEREWARSALRTAFEDRAST
jgi:hypothetical protein